MSDNTTAEVTTEPTTQGDPADAPLGDGGKKALQAERERANELDKQLKAAAAKLAEIEQANESALEKAQREAKEAQDAATKAAVDALRYKIAAENGIKDNADLILTAPDEETMRRQAELWSNRAPAVTTPAPDLTQGGASTPPALNSDGLERALKSKLGIN